MEPARDLFDTTHPLPDVFARWFASRGWQPRVHQLDLLAKAGAGRSTLLIAPTGGGKTLAGFLPTLVELSERDVRPRNLRSTGRALMRSQGLHTLYISPLKALAVDIARNLEIPVREMGLNIRLETRTGDTPTSKRQRQRRDPRISFSQHRSSLHCCSQAPMRPTCSARSGALCSTNCIRWSHPSGASCCRSAWRGCSRWRRSSRRSDCPRRLPSPTTCAV